MSDLAPFVAAVLRDKVIVEIKQEIDGLKEKLRECRTVTITGPQGTPVYAEGRFEQGEYGDNAFLWDVALEQQLQQPCPLSALPSVEVRVGGMTKAQFSDNSTFSGDFDPEDICDEDGGKVNFHFSGVGALCPTVRLHPFPSEVRFLEMEEQWNTLQVHILSFLSEVSASEQLDMVASFERIQFYVSSVNGTIRNLSLDPLVEQDAQRRRLEAGNSAMQIDNGDYVEGLEW
jgi:hypothetical protein